ncbi:MAG: PKD domain-containing protein, partial [Bacteroidota bacterium]
NLNEKLLKNWNHLKTEKQKSGTNLSYHTNQLSEEPHIREPLLYNSDGFDFYRIEGHQGKNYKTVLEEIDELKKRYGLAFDVKALSVNINRENLKIDDYECEFEDLNVLLRAWTKEQECVLAEVSEFFSGFSIAEPGANLKDETKAQQELEAKPGTATFSSATFKEAIPDTSEKTAESRMKSSFSQTFYSKSNIVSDHLITDENALGSVMLPVLEQYKDGSVNDLIVQAEILVNQKINTDAWSNQPEVKAFVIDQSIELMAYSHVLSRKMPGILVDVSDVNIANYKLTLKELCKRVDKMKTSYQNIELSAQLKAFMGVLITQLSSICCSAKKLEVLLEEINQRKENILLRLQLSKFVEKHPGLEHKAGVEPGGTFVLVYLNKSKPAEEEKAAEEAEFEERPGTEKGMTAASETFGNRISRLEKYIEAAKTGMIKEENISKYEKQLKGELERMVSGALAAEEITKNVVVADFSLPYMCCSDCSPVNFIIQKPPARLLLEKDEICLGKDSEIGFEVFPEDGVVEANREVPGMKIENKKLVFDANAFPEELLGETIRFTVNQQITDAELTVFKAPQVDFKAPEKAAVNQRVTFEPSGDIEGVSFLWDFGDGSPTSTEKSPSHRYLELPGNDDNSVVVKLVVVPSNGVCSATVEHKIQLFEIIIEVFLSEANYCENDEKAYPFSTSTGTDVTVEGPGVERDENGNFVFIPAKAGVGEHAFKINGKTADFSAKVHEAPVAKFSANQEGNQLVLTNNSRGAGNFVWTINGKKQEIADNSPVVINIEPNSPTAWRLSLEAISEFCGSDKQELTAETRFIDDEPEENTCINETGEIIRNDLKTLHKLNLPDSNFVVPAWMSTSQLYGGTAEFNKGVLDDLQNYLSGKNNAKLPELFTELLNSTAEMISRMAENPESEEYQRLLQIFVLQLQLFYNVLACQDKETIETSAEILAKLMDQIIALLQNLKEQKVAIPESFSAFLKNWSAKIEGKAILEEHWKIILENKLIS